MGSRRQDSAVSVSSTSRACCGRSIRASSSSRSSSATRSSAKYRWSCSARTSISREPSRSSSAWAEPDVPKQDGSTSVMSSKPSLSATYPRRRDVGGGHDHGSGGVKYEKPLWWAFGLTAAFLIAEVIGGLLTNSLALLSD